MSDQNQEQNEEQVNQPNEEQIGAEKLNAQSEEKLNHPLEKSDGFLPDESLFDQNQELNEEQINEPGKEQINQPEEDKINEEQVSKFNQEQAGDEQINKEQVDESNKKQASEELNIFNEEESNQPFENNDDFSEQESLELSDSAPSSKKRLIIIAAIVLGAILISGGLLFAAGRFFDIEIPLISKIFPKEIVKNVLDKTSAEELPEEVINKMFSSFKDIKTSRETFDLKITEENKDGEDKITNILLQGKWDLNILENPKLDYSFTFVQPNSNTVLSLIFKYIDETTYIKLAAAPQIAFFDLSQLQNQWFYFGKQEKENLKKFISNNVQVQPELNKKNQENISKIFKEAKLFKSIKSFQGDAIDSVPVFHYLIALDAKGFSEFITKLEEVAQNRFENQNFPVDFPQEKIDKIKKELEKIENIPVEIWIEKESYFLRKLSIGHFEFETDINGTDKIDVLLGLELNKINESIDAQAPKGGKSLEKIMENLFEKLNKQMLLNNANKLEITEDGDKDGLTNQEELFYGTDINNPDTDGDGFSDGDEVKNGYNPNGYNKL